MTHNSSQTRNLSPWEVKSERVSLTRNCWNDIKETIYVLFVCQFSYFEINPFLRKHRMDWKTIWTNFGVKTKNWSGKNIHFYEKTCLFKEIVSGFKNVHFWGKPPLLMQTSIFSKNAFFIVSLLKNNSSLEKYPLFDKMSTFWVKTIFLLC